MDNFYRFAKGFLTLLLLLYTLSVNAAEFQKIDYKNIKDNAKIAFVDGNWIDKVSKKTVDYFVKKSPIEDVEYSEFYSPQGDLVFSTGTQYEFIHKGSLIGYSNYDLKFYEFYFKNNSLQQRELTAEEVKELFPKYEIIKISDFSLNTNSIKIKKKSKNLKLILLNDTDRYFYNYSFTSSNSKYEEYFLRGFLKVSKKGMIQFAKFGENTKNSPWYVILVR